MRSERKDLHVEKKLALSQFLGENYEMTKTWLTKKWPPRKSLSFCMETLGIGMKRTNSFLLKNMLLASKQFRFTLWRIRKILMLVPVWIFWTICRKGFPITKAGLPFVLTILMTQTVFECFGSLVKMKMKNACMNYFVAMPFLSLKNGLWQRTRSGRWIL